MRTATMIGWALAGCSGTVTFDDPKAFVPDGDTDVAVTGTDEPSDSDVVIDTDVDPGTDTGGPLLDWACHAWDPQEDVGWAARYRLTVGNRTMQEVRQATGVSTVPGNVAGTVAVGFTVESVISGAQTGSQTLSHVVVCSTPNGRQGAFDIGMKSVSAAGTVQGGADAPARYLPARSALADGTSTSWTERTIWTLRVPVTSQLPVCPSHATVQIVTDEVFTPMGMEPVDAGVLGTVDAWRVQVAQSRTWETVDNNPVCQFFADVTDFMATSWFTQGFNANNASFPDGIIDRWYARGVGVVLEEMRRPNGVLQWRRELTGCEGLVGCP